MCKCSILTAIASGYAGRDPQGGFAMEAFKVFVENFIEEKRRFFFVLRNKNERRVKG